MAVVNFRFKPYKHIYPGELILINMNDPYGNKVQTTFKIVKIIGNQVYTNVPIIKGYESISAERLRHLINKGTDYICPYYE